MLRDLYMWNKSIDKNTMINLSITSLDMVTKIEIFNFIEKNKINIV